MLKNVIDEDRIKLFPKEKRKEYLRQCDMADGGCNDAELVDEMRRQGTLKVLDPRSYGRPDVRLTQPKMKELDSGYGFRRGQAVVVTVAWPWGNIEHHAIVKSIVGQFVRTTDEELYSVFRVKRA